MDFEKGKWAWEEIQKLQKEKCWGHFFLLSITHAAIDLLKVPSSHIWVYLGCLHVALVHLVYTKLQSVTLDDAPWHIPSSSCSVTFPSQSHIQMGQLGQWDAHMPLHRGLWALPPAGELMEITSCSCAVPQALHPSCACSSPQLLVPCSRGCVHMG